MHAIHDACPAPSRFLVYWQGTGGQLFAFTTAITAPSPQVARTYARHVMPRRGRFRILGVKQSAGEGLRTLNRGRWVA